ncbi:phosphotransferase [Kribbella sp. NPDC056951]|uniref:phosphotransferase n=1 Tax=Kribbella sp. NPDC056951 TaxID=3345978 RepID=UPI0036341EA5
MTRQVPLRLDRFPAGEVRRTALAGGITSPSVELVRVGSLEFVAKRATAAEAAALRLLPGDAGFPRLYDAGVDADGPWVVTSYAVGEVLDWSAEPPGEVYAALARLHGEYAGRELPVELPRVDGEFLRMSFGRFARAGVVRVDHPIREHALAMLDLFVADERLTRALDVLPATLLHGDVYGGNVVGTQLIDWGSARVGPAELDVTMAGGEAALTAYRAAGGVVSELGLAWGLAVNSAMFLGDVVRRSVELAEVMVREGLQAFAEVGRLVPDR